MVKVGILVGKHGRGSNMAALIRAMRVEPDLMTPRVVVAPSPSTPALELAADLGVATCVVPYAPPEDYGQRLLEALRGCDLVCLAGFMKLLPVEVIQAFPSRVLNIHPALLPRHGGQGMYGMRVHEAALAAGDTESGCTVHLVTERYDEGPILLQLRCPVLPDDTAESLAARVLELEHKAYPEALRSIALEVV